MRIQPLSIEGVLEVIPEQHHDARGTVVEWHRPDLLAEHVGEHFRAAQGTLSVSVRNTIRGIHFGSAGSRQEKLVTCVAGAVMDVVVDLRTGSPTFGRWQSRRLDDKTRHSIFIPSGVGHAFCSLADNTVVCYLTSTTYDPQAERTVSALDPQLDIPWPTAAPVLSARDRQAGRLEEAIAAGHLPRYSRQA
jgi:dTDP-4-dehydrorhamnose 3,5-epimerase